MYTAYQATPLEQWVDTIYRQHGITSPDDLNIETLASITNTWVYYKPISSRYIDRGNDMYSVVIDSRLAPKEQWEEFLHELCHVLRHTGNQHQMPDQLVKWQEEHAAAFQLYAAIPLSMLKILELPHLQSEAVGLLTEEFGVTSRLAERRLQQIQQRMLQGIVAVEYATYQQHKQEPEPEPDINFHIVEHSSETLRLIGKLSWLSAQKGKKINW
ncbi:MAG: ImmA/IrrE family metallo-endopeptidase [Gorillibacterium sp.]|nr:ImmA/IrrE family metallo-endopeptidase [Gorillibacterium sp.]